MYWARDNKSSRIYLGDGSLPKARRKASPSSVIMSTANRMYHKLKRPILLLVLVCSVIIHWHIYSLSRRDANMLERRKNPRKSNSQVAAALAPEVGEQHTIQIDSQQLALEIDSVMNKDAVLESKLETQPAKVRQKTSPKELEPAPEQPDPCVDLDSRAEFLPDVVHIPFEEAVFDDELQGWEDEWISEGTFDIQKWGKLAEPKIDILYTWVNGSETAFQNIMRPYELASPLNDPEGEWLSRHGTNRYRDWDELRYSVRSVFEYAGPFKNKIQILVNSLRGDQKQWPQWLKDDNKTTTAIEVLSQEDFFEPDKQACLPTFNSLTIENQLFNTKSDVDRIFVLSDDMLLTTPHSASDIYSPLFGPSLGFKSNSYNIVGAPVASDTQRFGEKPFLIYTSWLLNRRFGERKRKGQAHLGHSLSRRVTAEALRSFPRPALKSATRRFRGEAGPQGELGFQLYSWYAVFHYTVERQREALLWSYLLHRADADGDGLLGWQERKKVMAELEEGIAHEGQSTHRARHFLHLDELLQHAGLEPPLARSKTLWTSLDGPVAVQGLECPEFNVDECLAPGFSISSAGSKSVEVDGEAEAEERFPNPFFSTAAIFDRVARQQPRCGDCLIKILLNRQESGLGPLLPHSRPGASPAQRSRREVVVKALMRYSYSVVEPNAWFEMVTDAEMLEARLTKPLVRAEEGEKPIIGQLCLNDDVDARDEGEVEKVREAMGELLGGLMPGKGWWER